LCRSALLLWLLSALLRLLCGSALPFGLVIALALLSVDRSSGPKKQEQNCCSSSDRYSTFHFGTLLPGTYWILLKSFSSTAATPMALWFSTRSKSQRPPW
jgi:hypothetical protein